MTPGIRAEVRVEDPCDCPIATISGETGESTHSISKSVNPGDEGRVTEEFILNEEAAVKDVQLESVDLEEVFSYGSKQVYRFSRSRAHRCPCDCVEEFDSPVIDVRTEGDSLIMSFHAPDMDRVKQIVAALQEKYPSLDLQRLLRSESDQSEQNLVFIDRSDLTERQQEVLKTAHDMGYFEHPKGANAGEVAEELGITTSTFSEHLATAQNKLLGSILAPS